MFLQTRAQGGHEKALRFSLLTSILFRLRRSVVTEAYVTRGCLLSFGHKSLCEQMWMARDLPELVLFAFLLLPSYYVFILSVCLLLALSLLLLCSLLHAQPSEIQDPCKASSCNRRLLRSSDDMTCWRQQHSWPQCRKRQQARYRSKRCELYVALGQQCWQAEKHSSQSSCAKSPAECFVLGKTWKKQGRRKKRRRM